MRLPAAERRRQLLDAALVAFGTAGYHGTSMDDVATNAGVTKPVLYQHFRSKHALYRELLSDVGARLVDEITKATADAGGPRQQVEQGFAAYFRFVAGHGEAFTLLFGSGSRRDVAFADEVRAVEAAVADAIATLIEADVEPEQRKVLAHAIVGIAEGTSRHWVAHDLDLEPELLARQLADLAWFGLRGVHRVDG